MHTARAHMFVHEVISTLLILGGLARQQPKKLRDALLLTRTLGRGRKVTGILLLDKSILMNIIAYTPLTYEYNLYVDPVSVTVTKSLGTPSLRLPYQFETG